jgi:hypothetical protein
MLEIGRNVRIGPYVRVITAGAAAWWRPSSTEAPMPTGCTPEIRRGAFVNSIHKGGFE